MVALASVVGICRDDVHRDSYAQMSRAFPMAGSVYTYAGRGIPSVGGVPGRLVIILDYVLVPGLLYLIASVAMNSLLPTIPVWLC